MASRAPTVTSGNLPRYDRQQSYDWNYDHPPEPLWQAVPPLPGDWQLCGLPVDSPLGVPAGPLLNGAWCLYYASLGFDVVTYKTVRSAAHPCYPWPNLAPVESDLLLSAGRQLKAAEGERDSWAVSYGMPSREPAQWRADVERTRQALPAGKLLAVSVVGTPERCQTLAALADDYARCARWAVESGADLVETNFSCPNVATCDGQLYQQPDDAACVAQRVREAIGKRPLIAKIGFLAGERETQALVSALSPLVDALAMTNSIAARVQDVHGQPMFGGAPRGICGAAIRAASIDQVGRFAAEIRAQQSSLQIIGVGGAGSARDVADYLAAGATAVQLATAAMLRPEIALTIRQEWPDRFSTHDATERD